MHTDQNFGEIIRKIIRDYGEASLENPQFVLAVFSDLAPRMARERELVRAYLMCGRVRQLLYIKNGTKSEQQGFMDSMVRKLCDDQSLAEDAARYVCAAFYYGVTGKNWQYAPQKAAAPRRQPRDLDVYTTAMVKSLKSPASRKSAVTVDGQTVVIQIPESTKDGQQLKFVGQGRFDPETGTRGDLYVKVVIQLPKQSAGLKYLAGVLAVLALVLAACLLFRGKNAGEGTDPGGVAGHVHSWKDATCMAPKTCTGCGETSGSLGDHQWKDATCMAPKTCKVCGETSGSLGDHQWKDATETAPKTCTVCAATSGDPLPPPEELRKQQILSQAEGYAREGKYRLAIKTLDEAWAAYGDQTYLDLASQYRIDFTIYNSSVIAAGKYNSVLRYPNGEVLAVGESARNELDSNYWTRTAMIGVGDRHTVAMKTDGTVAAVGERVEKEAANWTDVVLISAGDVHTVGLLKDGSLISVGYGDPNADRTWADHHQRDLGAIERNAGGQRIVSIAAGHRQTLALLENGRVVACGDNSSGANNVTDWRNIAAIYAGTDYSAGLKTDGTVVTTEKGWDVSGWTDIVTLAAGDFFLLGLKADGTVLAVGDYRSCGIDVSGWRNIVHIAAGHDHAVAVDRDGRVICTGSNSYGQHFDKNTNVND